MECRGDHAQYDAVSHPGWWQLPGSEKRYRDWKKWGHGRLNVTRSLEESADTFFYQVAYDMGIDRLSEWMGKFGYGHYTGIDLAEERSVTCQPANGKSKCFKNRGIRVTPFRLVSVRVTGQRPQSR
ncbi:penicillin-binding transpeptidase domain-containing protein [Escherichia coli]